MTNMTDYVRFYLCTVQCPINVNVVYEVSSTKYRKKVGINNLSRYIICNVIKKTKDVV